MDVFWRSNKHEIRVAELEPGGEYYALRAVVQFSVPTEFGMIIGDIAHNLRSALDGLMWQLIIKSERNPSFLKTPNPAFPIFKEPSGPWESWSGKGLRHIRDKDGTYRVIPPYGDWIEEFQPYNSGDVNTSALWLLHQLNNADKHRLIQVAAIGLPTIMVIVGSDRLMENTTFCPGPLFLIDGEKIGEVHRSQVTEDKPQYQFFPEPAFQSGCPELAGRHVHMTLTAMWEQVALIIDKFKNEFGTLPQSLIDGFSVDFIHVAKRPHEKPVSFLPTKPAVPHKPK